MPFINEPDQLDTLDGMAAFMQGGVARIEDDFSEPGDDWINVLAVRSKKGVEIMPLPGEMFAEASGKDLLGELMRRLVAQRGAYRYALLVNSVGAPVPDQLEEFAASDRRVAELPDAVELLMLLVGDAESERLYTSQIGFEHGLRRAGPWRASSEGWESRFSHLNAYLRQQL